MVVMTGGFARNERSFPCPTWANYRHFDRVMSNSSWTRKSKVSLELRTYAAHYLAGMHAHGNKVPVLKKDLCTGFQLQ